LDLDKEIERKSGRSIPEIFESEGERGFRQIELEALRGAMTEERAILATGGGAPCQEGSMELLSAWGTVVFLHAPFDVLKGRVAHEGGRPKWRSDAERLYTDRLPLYRQAKFSVDATQPVADVAAAILRRLQ
jgi:shikimate kinase